MTTTRETCLHCKAPARNDGGDYTDLCDQWPLCETRRDPAHRLALAMGKAAERLGVCAAAAAEAHGWAALGTIAGAGRADTAVAAAHAEVEALEAAAVAAFRAGDTTTAARIRDLRALARLMVEEARFAADECAMLARAKARHTP